MNAKKCDRCGNFYDKPAVNPEIRVTKQRPLCGEYYIDLCDECQKKLEEFLKGENNND